MIGYDDIYSLKPDYETEPGWWKLKWRPLWRKTFSFYMIKHHGLLGIGIRGWSCSAYSGWNRSYNGFEVELTLIKWSIHFWIKWNYVVHKDGPSDTDKRMPLEIPIKEVGK